ncbi:PucR family transcriptional regulator [Pseudogracilibacillus sp. SO30301A]|uniref:PucR family transcriptional regulator n=1 Tax=Pseudogracilibacillus sp. SO30301A TaxID=3098291 RepID=UPI00300DF566
MLNQLKTIYPSIIRYDQQKQEHVNDYVWFITDQKEVFGILRKELSKKDLILLSTLLKRYNQLLPEKTNEEEYWYDLIAEKSSTAHLSPFRFIYFTIQPDQIDPTSFKAAITELFGKYVPILWEDETTGILVEEISITEEQIDYAQIIDILMADLSVHIHFYIGDIQANSSDIKQYYTSLLKGGKIIFQLTNEEVISYQQSIPYLLLNQTDKQTKKQLITSVLKKFEDDEEMLKTLEMFFNHNLNVSETAKKMYMHRNSLQYRIDKFTNETGINIQKFDQALAVKLALVAKKS